MKSKLFVAVMLIVVSLILSSSPTTFGQTPQTCEQCGMTVDSISQAHFKIIDSSGAQHYAECMMCALKLLSKYDSLNITTNCDYYGPGNTITVNAKQRGSDVIVNPTSALVIAGGGCAKNRIIYNQTAASALLANNGTSNYLAPIQKYLNGTSGPTVAVPINSNIMTVAQAALQFGGGTPSPSPSPITPSIQSCESCGMEVAADTQAHFKIVDGTAKVHYACCIKCAIKLLTKTDQLNITTNCDWFGPNFPITISVKDNLNTITVTPDTAMIIDGSCSKNRVIYDQTAANALLANNGTSKYVISSQNITILSNATTMSLLQAVRSYGASPSPSPSSSATPTPTASPAQTEKPTTSPSSTINPTPTSTITNNPTQQPLASPSPDLKPSSTASPTQNPSPTVIATPVGLKTQICEVCTMDVTPESQLRYKIADGAGTVHYVECFMCALNLVNDYETLHIVTYCDWYGPNYPITIDSTNYGQAITVSPVTAIFLRGGSCVTARAAYNQTAADNLLANGFSQYTSPEQLYALPSSTNATLIKEAIRTWYAQPNATSSPTSLMLVLIAAIGVIFIVGSIVAYKKLSKKV